MARPVWFVEATSRITLLPFRGFLCFAIIFFSSLLNEIHFHWPRFIKLKYFMRNVLVNRSNWKVMRMQTVNESRVLNQRTRLFKHFSQYSMTPNCFMPANTKKVTRESSTTGCQLWLSSNAIATSINHAFQASYKLMSFQEPISLVFVCCWMQSTRNVLYFKRFGCIFAAKPSEIYNPDYKHNAHEVCHFNGTANEHVSLHFHFYTVFQCQKLSSIKYDPT